MTLHEPMPAPATHDSAAPEEQLQLRRAERERRVEPRGTRQHTAAERIELLVDEGSFVHLHGLRGGAKGCGVITGRGLVDGRYVAVVAHDAAVSAGAIGPDMAEAVVHAQRFAIDHGFPIVYLNDSAGARVPDGVLALDACGRIFAHNVAAQQRIVQISVILGPCAGAAAYSPALTDWTIMVRGRSQMFLTGPDVVRAAIGEDATAEQIGGSAMHGQTSGVAHLEADDERDALEQTRLLLSFVPMHAGAAQRVLGAMPANPGTASALTKVVPSKSSVVFDMGYVLDGVLDNGARLELMPDFAKSVITQLARLDGRPVGIVANQPAARGGILDAKASMKIARFVDFCGRFGIPIITFVDVPGFLPGSHEEAQGVITHGASVLRAYASARSPRLTVIVRKAYGGAYIAMGSSSLGADATWAWPGAEVAVMGPGGAVALMHRRELAKAADPEALRDQLSADYRENVARPWVAAEHGVLNDVIAPQETRGTLIEALRAFTSGALV